MTKEEFNKRLKELKAEFDQKRNALSIEYAVRNNVIAIGDTIRDHISKGVVLKVQVTQSYDYPEMKYLCQILKKDGTPRKDGEQRWMFQSNVKELNGEPYSYDSSRTY